jgi:uncharacterized protein (DUF1501 family)
MLWDEVQCPVSRRNFLRVGAIGTSGLTLSRFLAAKAAAQESGTPATADSVVFIHLAGGPSHLDSFDPKPDASSEYRGEFNPIETAVPGLWISEHLPNLAKCADKFTLLRGVSHNLAAHDLGQKYVLSGNRPLPALEFPHICSVASKELGGPRDLPAYVAIPRTNLGAGYLGVAFGPFDTYQAPRAGQPFQVRGIAAAPQAKALGPRRRKLLESLDNRFGKFADEDELLSGLDKFSQKAFDILQSPKAQNAFDVSKEPASIQKRFGESSLGTSCLLATRLIEAGVRFVTVTDGGWDTHQDNFNRLKSRQLPGLDQGVSGLLLTLEERGLLRRTTVVVTGEFGRTPKINKTTGRDHWPRAMFMLLAGGGIQPGRVVGQSDENGMGPKETELTPDDVAATVYHTLGIDPTFEYHTPTGRPVMIVRNGRVLEELLS